MKQEDLIPGKEYMIEYTGEFCHQAFIHNMGTNYDLAKFPDEKIKVIFIGKIPIPESGSGYRNIFYIDGSYIMFDIKKLNYVSQIQNQEIIDNNSKIDFIIKELENLKIK